MKVKTTSYPAIALLVSLIVVITGFSLSIFGINNFLEEKRKYGVELVEDFRNYNLFQFYSYVLSDYEVRRIFFKTLYEEILNKSITNGILNATLYNKYLLENPRLQNYIGECDEIFKFVKYTIDQIDPNNKIHIFLYFPCFELPPIKDFHKSLNNTFINKLRTNYLNDNIFEMHALTISNYFNFTIRILKKEFEVKDSDILFIQHLGYYYKGKNEKITRFFELEIPYSIVPNILLYLKAFLYDYKRFLDNLIKNLEEVNQKIYDISFLTNYVDGSFIINDEDKDIIVFYKNVSKSFDNLLFLKDLYNLSHALTSSIRQTYKEIYFCDQLNFYTFSRYPLQYEEIYGCKIPKTPDALRKDRNYEYLIHTCMYDNYYKDGEPDIILAELCFYNFTNFFAGLLFAYPLLNYVTLPTVIINPIYGRDVHIVDSIYSSFKEYYRWPLKENLAYKAMIIGAYLPTRCVLGYKFVEGPYFHSNLSECLNNRTSLVQKYGRYRDPSIFVSECKELRIDTIPVYMVYVGRYSKKIYSSVYPSPLLLPRALECGPYNMSPRFVGVYTI